MGIEIDQNYVRQNVVYTYASLFSFGIYQLYTTIKAFGCAHSVRNHTGRSEHCTLNFFTSLPIRVGLSFSLLDQSPQRHLHKCNYQSSPTNFPLFLNFQFLTSHRLSCIEKHCNTKANAKPTAPLNGWKG